MGGRGWLGFRGGENLNERSEGEGVEGYTRRALWRKNCQDLEKKLAIGKRENRKKSGKES